MAGDSIVLLTGGMRMRPVACLATGWAAALLYSNFLFDWVLRGFTGMDIVVSYLETPGEPFSTLLRVTSVLCAVLVLLLLPGVRRAFPPGWPNRVLVISCAVFAAGAALAAAIPMPCGLGVGCLTDLDRLEADLHDAASTLSETALFIGVAAAWWQTRTTGPAWVARVAWWLFWIAGVLATAVFGYFGLLTDEQALTAYFQRVHILGVSIWLACLGVVAARAAATIGRGPDGE